MSYTKEEILLINKTTTEFYSLVSDEFSATRQHEWDGWNKCFKYFQSVSSVLDLGCGNRRFSKFLSSQTTEPNCHNFEIDSIDNFAWDEKVIQVDIVNSLINDSLNLKQYDVAVCFGLLHHIPSVELRMKLLNELTKSKIVIVSLWQFEKDVRIFNKAQETTKLAQKKLCINKLDENDFFLGWKDRTDVFRFCHNFTDTEIENIEQKFNVVEKYNADSNQKLNCYLILKESHG